MRDGELSTIIGPIDMLALIVTPRGNEMVRARCANYAGALSWGKEYMGQLRDRLGQEYDRLNFDHCELRIYN